MKRVAVLCVLAGLGMMLAIPGASSAGSGKAKIRAEVRIVDTNQAKVRSTGKLRVRVRLSVPRSAPKRLRRAPRRVAIVGTGSVGWAPRAKRILQARTRVRPNRTRVIKLRLNSHGRKVTGDCGTPSVKVTARLKVRKRPEVLRSSRRLKSQRSLCDVPREVDLGAADRCDFIAGPGNACLAPFPNDFYTRKDPASATGLRVDLHPASTPANVEGNHVGVTDLNRSDGFSPGPLLSLFVPGLNTQASLEASGLVTEGSMNRAFEPGQRAVLIDAETGERQLIWAELDSEAASDADRNLMIRVGRNLKNGHRYIFALRNLRDASGNPIAAPAGFRLYRDADRTDNPLVESRRAGFEEIFRTLSEKAAIPRGSLYLAWDFTVASEENLTGRMLSIRDRAFALLGDDVLTDGNGSSDGDAPEFSVNIDGVVDYPAEAPSSGPGVQNIRTVTGTFEVPCYLDEIGCPPGSRFDLDANQDPIRIPGNMMTARFTCNIPRSSVADTGSGLEVVKAARPSLYGHGLFGTLNEVNGTNIRQLGHENGVMVCGTDWRGMSSEDVPFTALPALLDLTKFPALPDRLQQGFLNFLFLGRLMIHDDGFTSHPAFRFGGESVIDTDDLFYYGNSQGGIAGGALTAIATDFTRSVLYVPAMNYSTMLTRSSNWDTYSSILYPRYTDELERPSIFSLMQMMWDRGEPNGYANNMTTDPLPGTPAHKVLIMMAYGDHQVANVATEVQARTIGAPLRLPALDDDRHPPAMIQPFFGHETLGDLAGAAAEGNGFVVWDIGPKRMQESPPGSGNLKLFGTDPAPLSNLAPVTSDSNGDGSDGSGIDPHDTVINSSPLARKQIADFLMTNGKITNPCGLNPCYAAQWKGMP